MRVEDEAGDFVCLIRDDRLIEEVLEWQIGEGHLCGDALPRGGGADAGQLIAGARRAGTGKQLRERVEGIADAAGGMRVGHWP